MDNTTFDDATKRELLQVISMEAKKGMVQELVHSFTATCWKTCVFDANSNTLSSRESACLQNCVNRFIETGRIMDDKLQTHNK